MKKSIRFISAALCVLMLVSLMTTAVFAAESSSKATGGDGDKDGNITWDWTEVDKVLRISGSGTMKAYKAGSAPWYSHNGQINKIVIGKGVTSIGRYAFWGLNKVTGVSLPDSMTKIYGFAFSGCDALKKIKITKNVSSISAVAFSDTKITSFTADKNNKNYSVIGGNLFTYNSAKNPVLFKYACGKSSDEYNVPNKTVAIGANAFDGASKLSNVNLGDKLTKINDCAFVNTTVKSLYIPKNVRSLGEYAFGFKTTDYETYKKVSGFKAYYAKGTSSADSVVEYCSDNKLSKSAVKLSMKSKSLKAGDEQSIDTTAGIAKSWVSNKKSVAAVKNGRLIAIKKGTAKITAKLSDGAVITGKVTVKNNPKLEKSSVSVKKGKTVSVKIIGKVKAINNVYNNTDIAKITSAKTVTTIKVKGLKKGSTTLMVKVNGVQLNLKVKVK